MSIVKKGDESLALDFLDGYVNRFNDYMDHDKCNAFYYACHNKMNKVAMRMLDYSHINFNCVDPIYGSSSFWYACTRNKEDVVLKMLDTHGMILTNHLFPVLYLRH